jgi:hypothetical protein
MPCCRRRRDHLAGCRWPPGLLRRGQSGPARTKPPPASGQPNAAGAQAAGSGRLRFLGLRVYDARLWAPGRTGRGDDWATRRWRWRLVYARALQGALIAERSLDRDARQGASTTHHGTLAGQAMTAAFPDVKDGDRLTGLHRPGDGARFFHNGTLRGEWRDTDFARQFFGIWLAPQHLGPACARPCCGRA